MPHKVHTTTPTHSTPSTRERRMTYDCFIFFNELELLELRFNELQSVVDKFVLVEGTRTFRNKEKPLYFQENRHLFEKFLDKIIHIIVDDYPEYENSWTNQIHQRNQIARGLEACTPEDIVLISDADEIPRPEALLKAQKLPGIKILELKKFYYYFNMINYRRPVCIKGTRMLQARDFTQPAHDIRKEKSARVRRVRNGGWHFSYLGGTDRIVTKIESISQPGINRDCFKDKKRLEDLIQSGEDLFGRSKFRFKYRAIPLDDTFPQYLLTHQDRFENMIAEPQPLSLIGKIMRFF